MAQVGDRVRYRNVEAIVTTVHEDGEVNLVYGDDYSSNSTGIWPVDTAANVPVEAIEARDDQSGTGGEETDDTESGGEDGDVSTQGDVIIKDYDDADDFVGRTPVSDVASDIRSGDYDDVLDVIEAAEEAGRDRDTVYEAIESRR